MALVAIGYFQGTRSGGAIASISVRSTLMLTAEAVLRLRESGIIGQVTCAVLFTPV